MSVYRRICHILFDYYGVSKLIRILFQRRILHLTSRLAYSYGVLYLHPVNCMAYGVAPNQLAIVRFSLLIGKEHKLIQRLLRIVPADISMNQFVIGRDDLFNISDKHWKANVTLESIECRKWESRSLRPSRADTVRLSSIKQPGLRHDKLYKEALNEFAHTEHVIYGGDVFSIYIGDVNLGLKRSILCFKIECSESPSIFCTGTSVYEVSSSSSKIPFGAAVTPIMELPNPLICTLHRMRDVCWNFPMVSEKPLCLLLSGAPGSGKRWLVRRLASDICMNYIEYNCYDLWSDVSAQAEQKLKHALEKAKSSQPALLNLRGVGLLGFDPNSLELDARVIGTLRSFLSDRAAVIVVLTCLSEEISKLHRSLASLTLYDFEIDHLNELEREQFLVPLLSEMAGYAAKNSAGFSLSELSAVARDATFRGVTCNNDESALIDWSIDLRNASFADAIGAPKIPSVSWEDVGGLEDVKKMVIESIQASMYSNRTLKRSGIILFGPPGCGKTLIAKAVSTEFKIAFLSVKGPELLNKYIGQSEENLRKVFERARQAAPCVVFFDELDSLAPNRGRSGDSGGVMDRIVSQLLSELDTLHCDPQSKVFVMGATNRADLLDQSLLTPGRFDKVINISPGSTPETKAAILRAVSRKVDMDKDVDLLNLALSCPKVMSGAELYSVVSVAAMAALREQIDLIESGFRSLEDGSVVISTKHLEMAANEVRRRKEL